MALVLTWALNAGPTVQGQTPSQTPAQKKKDEPYKPTAEERASIESKVAELGKVVESLRARLGEGSGARDAVADIEICHKAAAWTLRFNEFYEAKDVARTLKVLETGLARARDLQANRAPWADALGKKVVRGYRSKVDGSVQPYALNVPANLPTDERVRLDVVLHGRDLRLSEVRFFDLHDGKPTPDDQKGLVLHVFGRTNNAYRWAGESDLNEAIDAVKRNYRVDDRRIVLRGFSMGGAGAWHIGLHSPSRWSSVEAGAGFSETILYTKLKNPSDSILKGLHIYDAVDYAANAFNVPIVGYGGENDPQAQASKNILEALVAQGVVMKTEGLVTKAEGLDFTRIIGKGMGHAVDKESAALMKAFHDTRAEKGSDPYPRKLKFVTYTLKYNKVGWISVERLIEHYRKATVEAEVAGETATVKTDNVGALAIARNAAENLVLDGQEFELRDAVQGLLPDVYFRKTGKGWEQLDHDDSVALQRNGRGEKQPGLQGPIDDAFTGSFLCVKGTGKPWNPKVQAWSEARLERFASEWSRYLRGDLRIKNDVDVTEQDIEENHLILFGDPGSNRWIAQTLRELPLTWTEKEIKLNGSFDSASHAPVLIAPNPLNKLRYVVLNSGHTFGKKEFEGTNALLYPKIGDLGVIEIEKDEPQTSGYFNERWRLP